MSRGTGSREPSGLLWRILSVPIFYKTLGIGAVVAIIFGGLTVWQARRSATANVHRLLERQARSTATALAASLEGPVTTRDVLTVHERLRALTTHDYDVRYAIVLDASGQVMAHTFPGHVPPSLLTPTPLPLTRCAFRTLGTPEGLVFEVTCPLVKGLAGTLQLGLHDRTARATVQGITRSIVWGLAVSVLLGVTLALVLAHLLTRPLRSLKHAAVQIERGHFGTQSEVWSGDEIGQLAIVFNGMSDSLEDFRTQVEQKERARQALIAKLVSAQEEERRAISRELHDQIGQSLLAVLLRIQAMEREPGLNGPGHEVEAQLRAAIEEVRQLARGMHPSILDDGGLDSALARYVEETTQRTGLVLDYHYTCLVDSKRLPQPIEVALYRVAQEATANIIRHAQATHASLIILRQRRLVTLLVDDDGKGLDLSSEDTKKGLGLTSMRERATLVGGSFELESRPGQGTTVRVTIPL